MEYYAVYDPKGEMFEVSASKLNKLVVKLGWTFWHPSEQKIVFKDAEGKRDG